MAKLNRRSAIVLAALALLLVAFVAPLGAEPGNDNRAPDLSDYPKLQVDEGHKVAFSVYAEGVQIYRWNTIAQAWVFVAPEAVLYDQDGDVVGIHYAGPT